MSGCSYKRNGGSLRSVHHTNRIQDTSYDNTDCRVLGKPVGYFTYPENTAVSRSPWERGVRDEWVHRVNFLF